MLAILDYGIGNLRSVQKTFEVFGVFPKITSSPQDLKEAERIVIPGVGAYGKGIDNLTALGVIDTLKEEILHKKKPLMGICVGMQILSDLGTEFGTHKGLGWIHGEVHSLSEISGGLPIPNMGWCPVEFNSDKMFQGITPGSSFYFANSFYFKPTESNDVAAWTTYGQKFACALKKDNIWAVQFHPEKSQKVGIQVLKNFCTLT